MADTEGARIAEYVAPTEALWAGLEPPYRTIVADPPWTYEQGGPMTSPVGRDRPFKRGPKTPPYPMMSVEAIAVMPVAELADKDAHLYLWTTSRYLKDAHAIAERWGFRYSQTLTWCKKPMGLGPGGAYCNTTEFVLFCRKGKLAPLARSNTSWWLWPRRAHSVKPPEFYDVVEGISPGPYLDLFARAKRLGWDGWGDEYGGRSEEAYWRRITQAADARNAALIDGSASEEFRDGLR